MGLLNWLRPEHKQPSNGQARETSVDSVSREVMLSVMEDSLEERNRALRLATENQQLAAIVQQSDEGIVQLAPNGKVLTINHSAKKFFAIDIDSGADFYFVDLFDKSDQAAIKHTLSKVMLNKENIRPLTLHKGSADLDHAFVYELKFSSLSDNNDEIFSIVVAIRDISSLHQQQEELRLIIEQAPNALIMADQRGKIIVTNAQAEKLFGYTNDELVNQSVELLVPDGIRPSHPELRAKFMAAPEARAMGAGRDLTARRKDGSEVAVEIGLNPIHTRNGHFVVASVVDITERKRQQAELETINQQLQQKNKEMEQFIYTISHDLKSPLVTIAGFSQRLRAGSQHQLTDKQHHQINRIEANIHHMETLLNDLLGLSRVIHQEIKKDLIDTGTLIAEVISRLEEGINRSNAAIHVADQLASLYGNKQMLAQCLQNLVDNAIQYRDPNRPLQIRIEAYNQGSVTHLQVSDNGIGIEDKHFDRIFRIFERLNVGQGTGVGLSIVKTIVEKHGGHIKLQSQPGLGSTFTLILPGKALPNN